ncbi:MAG: multicopper oxidase domain-containing protein [Chloroflexi bacterium]|nr:multicopper oxidase domain-containing protein [Chloroflexota bacterium]
MNRRKKKSEVIGRRQFLKASALTGGVAAVSAALGTDLNPTANLTKSKISDHDNNTHGGFGAVGQVDYARNGFDPSELLYDWDYGEVSELDNGQTLREYTFVAVDKEIEIAPGVFFPAWTYNGRVPGPTIRCVEGDRIKIEFINAGSHPHTIHFHGIHPASMDGLPGFYAGSIAPGESTVYEFDAFPFGCHLYHCHSVPLKRHIHKGLYGAFIVDPDPDKYSGEEKQIAKTRNHNYRENENVNEMMMIMNGFDTNFDGDNEIYAVNSIAFAYSADNAPIRIRKSQRQRIYLINVTEFDPINSLHLHANFFNYYDHGTTLQPTLRTIDTVMQCQAQRGILEFSFADFEPGMYMFHAHQSEFAELGWMAFFDVVEG